MRNASLYFITAICLAALAACEQGLDPAAPPGPDQGAEQGSNQGSNEGDNDGQPEGDNENESDGTPKPPPDETQGPLNLPDVPYNYAKLNLPAHFTDAFAVARDNTPADNPVTDHGATLGRVLFYDAALSANGTIACASCHLQKTGFTDPAQFSVGFEGGHTGRNAMSLMEARYYRNGRFFWDERAATLEDQVLMPIQNEVEMGLSLDELVKRVGAQSYYPALFEAAFGDPAISTDRISKALAQFVRSIVSYRSRFDEGLAQAGTAAAPFPNFTQQENHGKALFIGPAGCAPCHLDDGPPHPGPRRNNSFFLIDFAVNNGVDQGAPADDKGLGAVTGNPADNGRFKSPSLRNVAVTGPYMHDGRFATLAEVIEHYNSGVKPHPNLDPRLRVPNTNPPAPRKLNLTQADKAALAAFLETLTDDELAVDPKYADPFVQ